MLVYILRKPLSFSKSWIKRLDYRLLRPRLKRQPAYCANLTWSRIFTTQKAPDKAPKTRILRQIFGTLFSKIVFIKL